MEAMACGIPTYVSANTGQKDLINLIGCGAFRAQSVVKPSVAMQTTQDWGETEVDEVVEAMEKVYTQREESRREAGQVALRMKDWAWGPLNEKLLRIVCDGKTSE